MKFNCKCSEMVKTYVSNNYFIKIVIDNKNFKDYDPILLEVGLKNLNLGNLY